MASFNDSITKIFILVCLLLISTYSHSKRHPCLTEQQNALLQFKNSFRVTSNVPDELCLPLHAVDRTESWKNDTDCCIWDGVTCNNKTGDVKSLDISCSGLEGTIHKNSSLFLLKNLWSLNLAFNALDGSVNSFTQLSNLLHLDLSFNYFYGTTFLDISHKGTINNSTSLFPLQNLQSLNLANNFLSGSLNFLGQLSGLVHLDLSSNGFSGIMRCEIAHLSQLKALSLTGNNVTFTSSILDLLIQNLTQVLELNLEDVGMYEVFPSSLLNMSTTLTFLNLRNSGLKGNFPDYIFHLPYMRFLDVGENLGLTSQLPKLNRSSPLISLYLSSTGFWGSIPNSIGNLKNLENLDLHSCHFTSLIPSSICNLSSIQGLVLSGNNFSGSIPPCLGHLTNLQQLDMSLNQLTGPLPRSLNNCTLLQRINVSSNMLSDTSPSWLGRLPNLLDVDLGKNKFYGPIGRLFGGSMLKSLILTQNSFSGCLPDFDGSSLLRALDLSSNRLEGPIPMLPHQVLNFLVLSNNKFTGEIPPSICKLDPTILDFSNNSLSGIIPSCLLSRFSPSAYFIKLGRNKLEGVIPDTFTKSNNIMALDLSENQLKGPLPRSMINCSELVLLDLRNNYIEDSFPNWLESLPELQVLTLESNKFNGKINTLSTNHSSPKFPKLRLFDISNNNFTGLIPVGYISQLGAMKNVEIFQEGLGYTDKMEVYADAFGYFLSTRLTIKGLKLDLPKIFLGWTLVDFSNNNFQGEIPQVIGELVALKGLNLSHNNLTGSIPLSITNLTSLEWLDLSSNKLNGLIPSDLTHLTELSTLNLSYNELKGMIPRGQQFETFGMESFLGNPGLCGSQVTKACDEPNISKQPHLPLPPTEADDFSAFDWRIILMGYGCGVVIGVSIGYIVFELQRPEWFVSMVEEKLLRKLARTSRWRT